MPVHRNVFTAQTGTRCCHRKRDLGIPNGLLVLNAIFVLNQPKTRLVLPQKQGKVLCSNAISTYILSLVGVALIAEIPRPLTKEVTQYWKARLPAWVPLPCLQLAQWSPDGGLLCLSTGSAGNKRDNENDVGSSSSGLSLVLTLPFLVKNLLSVKQ